MCLKTKQVLKLSNFTSLGGKNLKIFWNLYNFLKLKYIFKVYNAFQKKLDNLKLDYLTQKLSSLLSRSKKHLITSRVESEPERLNPALGSALASSQ